MAILDYGEKLDSPSITVSPDNQSAERHWWVATGTDDPGAEDEVLALASTLVPQKYADVTLQSYKIVAKGAGHWDLDASWGRKDVKSKEVGESEFSFDTTGGKQKITQSLSTISRNAPGGDVAADCEGAIGVTGDRVEGVEITIPQYAFEETHYLAGWAVTNAYKAVLFDTTGKVNDGPFRGMFQAGEVLFLGASGKKKGAEDWAITYKFTASPNKTNVDVGPNITVTTKLGWEYLWVQYDDADDMSAKRRIKRPVAAYVEKVYEYANFAELGIGA